MPVTYRIDKPRGLIHTSCTGAVTLEEVLEHFGTLARDPQCPAQLDVLLDLEKMTSLPTSDELRAVSRRIGEVRDSVRFGFCATVAPRDALFGMIRVFSVFAEKYFEELRVVRTSQEARGWLYAMRHPALDPRQSPDGASSREDR